MIDEYFNALQQGFDSAYAVASKARAKGYDPEKAVEIRPAPDIASRVEGIVGIEGIAKLIRDKANGKSREALAFEMVKDICINPKFDDYGVERRLTAAVRVGLAIHTEGVVVAPTEGVQGVELHRNQDRSDYVAVLYAGPIRSAGGTSVALSAAFADYGRRLLGIGAYKAEQTEIDRYLEEIELYHAKAARLQYLPSEADIRAILENCPVCIDGVPTEQMEVSINRNLKRLDAAGREQFMTNRVRGGVALVTCEGIAQKARSVLKHTRNAGLDWNWLNNIIKVEKPTTKGVEKDGYKFLQEGLVAGRPIFSYPEHSGGFRLRYGRSRLTGIAAKGLNPATMIILDGFIACGTQLKIEKPGKGCVIAPVDTIEGPFVKLTTGEALRVNTAEQANELKGKIAKIISVGDILITYGDFKKTNTQLLPSSYVEEFWAEQLRAKGCNDTSIGSFEDAYRLSAKYGVPMHPLYTYDYNDITAEELIGLARALAGAKTYADGKAIFGLESLAIEDTDEAVVGALERLCVPHTSNGRSVFVKGDAAQSLLMSLGLVEGTALEITGGAIAKYKAGGVPLDMVNSVAPFKVMRRSTRIGGRMGRPEKAKERLMQPAPYFLFPIGEYGGRERSVYKAYADSKAKFGGKNITVEIARYRCELGGELVDFPYCQRHGSGARISRLCSVCGRESDGSTCKFCSGAMVGYQMAEMDIIAAVDSALKNIGLQEAPKTLRGVRGLSNRDKAAEPIEKGLLRAVHNVHIFKDGTARFDATDAPMTHFYPSEIGVSVERLRALGYAKDYTGKNLTDGSQLVELRHQDVVINRRGAEHLLNVARFVDDLLVRYYKAGPFYKAGTIDDLVGHFVITLAPHTSAGVLCRVVGFTDAKVGFAHPYTIAARRRNCDGDEDTTMLLLDALLNFSRRYLPTTIGGTMDAPLILTIKVRPEEVDDEVYDMEVAPSYGLDFYNKTLEYAQPGEAVVEMVRNRFENDGKFENMNFTHLSTDRAIESAPKSSVYTTLNSMSEKVELQFSLMDRLESVDRSDTARKLILGHFVPDLIGNMHSFSKQGFRCISCNAKYRRVPLIGKCTKCSGRLVLTISRGSIEKYLDMAINLANRYNLEPYIKQRLVLAREEIENVFGGTVGEGATTKQFNLARFI